MLPRQLLLASPGSACPAPLHLQARCQHRTSRGRAGPAVCAARGNTNSNWRGPQEPFDETTKRALREAAELLSEAQELARQQTLADLMASWTADSVTGPEPTAAAAAVTPPPSQPTQQQQTPAPQPPAGAAAAGRESSSSSSSSSTGSDTGTQQQLPGSTADLQAAAAAAAAAVVSSDAALQAFWCEQGLSQPQAQQLMKEVAADGQLAAACRNTQLLGQKLWSLGRVLPGVDVVRLVARSPRLLLLPSTRAVAILVGLVNALPGVDVVDMVSRQPRLLLQEAEGLPQRLEAVLAKLTELHPSHSGAVVAGLIEENPELLLRMPYYLGADVRLLDDLPIEIQNMMVLGDHGVGYLYRYWGNKLTERSSKAQWDTGGGSSSSGSAA